MEFVSQYSRTTKLQVFTGPTAVADAQKAAQALADSSNSSVNANVICNGKKITVPAYPSKNASDENAYIEITEEKSGKIDNPSTTARLLAEQVAAYRNITTKVTVNGVEYTATPPARPSDIKNAAKGTPGTVAGTDTKEPNLRKAAIASMQQAKRGSANDENDGGGSPERTGSSSFEKSVQYNIPREVTGKISSMEGVLEGVESGALKSVLGNLPGEFKSLLPVGSLPGLLKQASIPVNNLVKIASGAAIGNAASQAVSSVSSGVNVASDVGSFLSSVSIAKGNAAVLSNVMGAAINIKSNYSIPLENIKINSVYSNNISASAIPIVINGINSNDTVFNGIAQMVQATVGMIPLKPVNLSITSIATSTVISGLGGSGTGTLAGIPQKLSSFDTANLFSSDSLTSSLPKSVSNLIDSGRPPRTYNPGAMGMSPNAKPFKMSPNDIANRRKASPSQRLNLPRGAAHPPKDPPSGSVKKNNQIDYGLIISPNGRTLAELTKSGAKGGYELPNDGQLGLSLDQIVEGLKYVATNACDPLDKTFGKGKIVNGFRGPGGSDYGKSDHCFGAAVDMSWNGAAKNYEAAQWAVKYIKDAKVYLVFLYKGDVGYVHIACGPNQKYQYPSEFGTTFDDGKSYKPGIQRPDWI